jgi:four helix bundle protein
MVVRHHRDLIAWQLADQFKKEVFRLLESSPAARSDFRYRSQLVDSATSVTANLVEGFRRFSPGDFPRFIDYSLASLGEAEQRLRDGIELGYFKEGACEAAFKLARRCLTAAIRLKQSQRRFKPKRRG